MKMKKGCEIKIKRDILGRPKMVKVSKNCSDE